MNRRARHDRAQEFLELSRQSRQGLSGAVDENLRPAAGPGLKDSVGAGPYHSNHCLWNSVKNLSETIEILLVCYPNSSEIQKFDEISTLSTEVGKIPRKFQQNLCKIR